MNTSCRTFEHVFVVSGPSRVNYEATNSFELNENYFSFDPMLFLFHFFFSH